MQQIFSHVRENLGNANATGTMITVVNLSVILHYRLKHQPSLKKKKKLFPLFLGKSSITETNELPLTICKPNFMSFSYFYKLVQYLRV